MRKRIRHAKERTANAIRMALRAKCLKVKGLCTKCGKRKAALGVLYCKLCRKIQHEYYKKAVSTPQGKRRRKEAFRRWCAANPDRVRERQRYYIRRIRLEVLAHYGNKCVCCGEYRHQFLTLDHINNDGARHREETGCASGGNFYRWVKRAGMPKGLVQILCWNCNEAKAHYGTCPHKEG